MIFIIYAENLLQKISKYYDFSQNIDFLFEILSKIVVKKLQIMLLIKFIQHARWMKTESNQEVT